MSEVFSYNPEEAAARALREASELIQSLFIKGTLGKRMREAEKELKWTPNRVREIFNGRAARIDSHEMDALRALKKAREIKEAQDEFTEFRTRLARLEAVLAVGDAEHHQPYLEVLRQSLHGLGRMVGGSRNDEGRQ